MSVTAGDDELGVARVRGRALQDGVWDAAQSALCSRASLCARWLGRTRTGARRVAPARTGRPGATSGGIWLTTFAAPAGTPVVRSRSACRRRWRMTSASTVLDPWSVCTYCRGEGGGHPLSVGHRARDGHRPRAGGSAARATLVACLQGPPPDASEEVCPRPPGSSSIGGLSHPALRSVECHRTSGWLWVSWSRSAPWCRLG